MTLSPIISDLPVRLKSARTQAGLSQAQTALLLHTTNISISRYETGERQPSLDTLADLAEVYGVSLGWLVSGESQLTEDEQGKIRTTLARLKSTDIDSMIALLQSLSRAGGAPNGGAE
jgi:transcriptional regulator with XRE-family HTH domain